MICPVCGHFVDDADYWDDKTGICVRCLLEIETEKEDSKTFEGE